MMNDVPCSMCEKCKYRDVSSFSRPCVTCKYSFERGTCQFDTCKSFFEPEHEEAAPAEVDHPAHYAGKYECIDVMVDVFGPEYVQAFCLCNAFKYLYRCMKKHEAPVEDIEKAEWYLTKFLKLESVADGE